MMSHVGDQILQEFYYSVSDQIQNLQNCYTTPNKNLGGEESPHTDKHLLQSPFTGQFFFNDKIFSVSL
jgi:hypothetical protein